MCIELNEREFIQTFSNEEKCKEFIYELKWRNGFICRRCGNKHFWKGRTRFHVRCRECGYDESLTAHTIFHKVHIPLVKAFSIIYHVVGYKKGISTLDLSRIVSVSQKSVWYLKRKLQEVMGADIAEACTGTTKQRIGVVDGVILNHCGDKLNGLQRVIVGIDHSWEEVNDSVTTTFSAIEESRTFEPCNLVGGRYVDEGKSIFHYGFRSWLTGIHHHCSGKYLKGYFDEFSFRFAYRADGLKIWYRLLAVAMRSKPYVYLRNGVKGHNRMH